VVVASLDTKPYVQHHPVFGYRYIPNADILLRRPGGGRYRIRVNAQGIRSDREYSPSKPARTYRMIVLGDSMAAGQFVTNACRFSELLERRVPGLEVVNLALEGSGTDQQLLLYQHLGLTFEHDAVLLLPFLQNIRRNLVDARDAIDPRTQMKTLRPKPRFEVVDGELTLKNVPVPMDVRQETLAGAAEAPAPAWKTRAANLPGVNVWRRAFQSVIPWEPFPEYREVDGAAWQLMRAIITRIKTLAGDRPLVLAPTFYANYVRFRMARNYWARFSSLRELPRIHPVDLLPYFREVDDPEASFQEPHDIHFSLMGHVVLAEALQVELGRLGLLPTAPAGG
jgi:carbamoyltransferase